jgi:hypothetical protein
MKPRYLEVTYRRGKPVAAYFYLPRQPGDVSTRSVPNDSGLVTDYAADDRAIGIEITSPSSLTLASLNQALSIARQAPATPDDLAPLLAASSPASANG